MLNPTSQKPSYSLLPGAVWFWRGSGEPYRLHVQNISVVTNIDNIEIFNATNYMKHDLPGPMKFSGTMSVSGVSSQLLASFLGMTGNANDLQNWYADDVAITSGSGTLDVSSISDKCIEVWDENGLRLNYTTSGTPDLGYFSASGTALTVNSAVDGVNYRVQALATGSTSTEGERYQLDMTSLCPKQFTLWAAGKTINPETGECYEDNSNADLKYVNGIYVEKMSINGEVPLFHAADEDHFWDLNFSILIADPSDFYIYRPLLDASPTS